MPSRKIVPTQSRVVQHYGWQPDLPDKRDHLFSLGVRKPAALPKRVDLRSECPPVEDQGQLGSCTANALAGALQFLEKKAALGTVVDLSRLFIYYNERVIEKTVAQDSGAMMRDGIKTLAKQGVCSEKRWPYVITQFSKKPTPACYTEAARHRISSYQRLAATSDMRACLADGYPFVFGFTVYESFESAAMARTGVLNLPKKTEKVVGGHAVCAVGYDDASQRFIARNSWGTDWGMAGYFTIPYDYLADRNLSDDFWTIRR
jgi:C1A family cysteine protease